MKVTYTLENPIVPVDLETFRINCGFRLIVTRHDKKHVFDETLNAPHDRYTARFEYVEVLKGGILSSTYGDADTIEEAIKNYAARIAGKQLYYKAMHAEERRIVLAPDYLTVDV